MPDAFPVPVPVFAPVIEYVTDGMPQLSAVTDPIELTMAEQDTLDVLTVMDAGQMIDGI